MRKSKTTEEWIQEAKIVHGDKYDYSRVKYTKSNEKVEIICPIHGSFWQIANNHLRGSGCLKCKVEYVAKLLKGNIKSFIEKANKVHNFKYDYSKSVYGKNNKEKICIICPKHGEFWQSPHDHLSGYGCLLCSRDNNQQKQKDTLEIFIEKANKIHYNKYDYSKVNYINSKTFVTIICPEHGKFEQRPGSHLMGHGCPKCRLKSQTKLYEKLKESFPDEKILFEVNSNIVPWLGLLRFDIYFPKYNIAVEYNGILHYVSKEHFGGKMGFENILNRDRLKQQKCKENNCILFEIKYNYLEQDYNNLVININNIIKNYEN